MFDPERDVEREGWSVVARLLAIAIVTTLACLTLWPSISAYSTNGDARSCVALVDGWRAPRVEPGPAATPDQVEAYDQWQERIGRCIPEARHRLMVSGLGLGAVLSGALLLLIVVRRRRTRNDRPEGRPQEPVLVG
jgi:hypothetical protein